MAEKTDKIKELIDQLEDGIKNVLSSEKYKDFLKCYSNFHNYSWNNSLLIYLQKPEASRVAGYKTWQKLGRHVQKGEKAIKILAPTTYTVEKEKLDNKGNKIIDPKTGEAEKEKIQIKGTTFRTVNVFDISQTDGKELPSICEELKGNNIKSQSIVDVVMHISSIPISFDYKGEGKGAFSPSSNEIQIKANMSLDQTVKTLLHEYCHADLHSKDSPINADYKTGEVQAESVAFIIANHFGVDTSDYSFEYMASWSSNKDLPELKSSFDVIHKTAKKIIADIELGVLNLEQKKEIQNENQYIKHGIIAIDKEMALDAIKKYNVVLLDKNMPISQNHLLEGYQGLIGMFEADYKNYAKDFVIDRYQNEFKGIKYMSSVSCMEIIKINKEMDKTLNFKALKEYLRETAKTLDSSENPNDKNKLLAYDSVLNNISQAQLKERAEIADKNAKCQEKMNEVEIGG